MLLPSHHYYHFSLSVLVVAITVTVVPKVWSLDASKCKKVIAATGRRNGRPGSQAVSEKFSVDWGTYMSIHNDVVYIKLDVRGARGQGSQSLYRHLGGVEVQDQTTVLRSVVKLPKHCPQILRGTLSDTPTVVNAFCLNQKYLDQLNSPDEWHFDSFSCKGLWQYSTIALWDFFEVLSIVCMKNICIISRLGMPPSSGTEKET